MELVGKRASAPFPAGNDRKRSDLRDSIAQDFDRFCLPFPSVSGGKATKVSEVCWK